MVTMSWFEGLFGFEESRYSVYKHFRVETNNNTGNQILHCKATNKQYDIGKLTITNYSNIEQSSISPTKITLTNICANVADLLVDPVNNGATFQVASQANLLEMVNEYRTPEDGISSYCWDHTQGPACAIAAAPATVYRNYFVFGNQEGQTTDRQINTFSKFLTQLGLDPQACTTNGYLTIEDHLMLTNVDQHLTQCSVEALEALRASINVGIHSNVQVTTSVSLTQRVTQVFCSAVPIAYNKHATSCCWYNIAKIVLESAYRSTLATAAQIAMNGGSNVVYLTLLGGGAFGNSPHIITDAIVYALTRTISQVPLDVRIVSQYADIPQYLLDVEQLFTD